MSSEIPHGWLDDAEADCLAELATGLTVIEFGAGLGRSTLTLASTAAHVVSVDWHKGDEGFEFGDTLPGYWEKVRGLDTVTMVVGRFESIVPLFAPVFQLAFVDGSRAVDAVERDARLAAKVTRGTVVFHDYDVPAVRAAVTAVFGPRPRVVGTLAICKTLA